MVRSYKRRKVQQGIKELRPGRRRMSLDIPSTLYKKTQEGAERSNVTLTMYVIRSLRDRLKKEGIADDHE